MNSIQMDTIIAVNASILEETNSEKIESKYNTCIVHKRQQQRQQYNNQPPRRLEDKNAVPVSLRFLPNSYFRNRNSLSTTIAADLGVLNNKNHTSFDQLLEHFDRSCEMMSSEDQEQEDTTVTASTITSLPIIASSLSSSIMTSTAFDSTNTASTAKSSLKRKIRIANDDLHNEIVSTSTQRCDDNYQRSNNSPKRMKRMKYARRNSVVIRDSKQLSQIATDLSTISTN